MGIMADIYTPKGYRHNSSNGGLSSQVDEVTIVNVDGPFEPDERRPAVLLRPGPLQTVHAVPAEMVCPGEYGPMGFPDKLGPMMGGSYIATSDSRFGQTVADLLGFPFYGAVAFHDRYETQAEYDALST